MKKKTRQKLNKMLTRKKKRKAKRLGVLQLIGVRGLLSPSLMNKCFEMCFHRLIQNPQQETSVPLQGIFMSHVTIILKHRFQKKEKMFFFKICFIGKRMLFLKMCFMSVKYCLYAED